MLQCGRKCEVVPQLNRIVCDYSLREVWSGSIEVCCRNAWNLCAGRQIYVNIFVASWHGFMYNSLQFYFICVTLVIVLLVGRFLYASDTDSISMTGGI